MEEEHTVSERLPEDRLEGLSKTRLISRGQSSQRFEHEGGVDGRRDWFEHGGFEQSRRRQSWIWTSPTVNVEGCWLVIAMMRRSGGPDDRRHY